MGRNLSKKIAAVEALQLIGGWADPDWTVKHAPSMQPYRDGDNTSFWGAYGNRIGDQTAHVLDKLIRDSNTRQAVITLWDPTLDNHAGHNDYPCTVGIGFSADSSREELHMRVTMRSNDAWLGLPYDMFQFAQLHLTLCNLLGYFPGRYTHTAWSMHLYCQHAPQTYDVTEFTAPTDTAQPIGFGNLEMSFQRVRGITRAIAFPVADVNVELFDPSERWFYDALNG